VDRGLFLLADRLVSPGEEVLDPADPEAAVRRCRIFFLDSREGLLIEDLEPGKVLGVVYGVSKGFIAALDRVRERCRLGGDAPCHAQENRKNEAAAKLHHERHSTTARATPPHAPLTVR
jgi:hypothetical protein